MHSIKNEREYGHIASLLIIQDIISAFQKFACCKYEELSDKAGRVNDFQIVDRGSSLFQEVSNCGYDYWLTEAELNHIKVMFQRRHLLEHNNGMVDKKYLDNTNDDSYKEGQRLRVKEADAYSLLESIKKLGMGLLSLPCEGAYE